MSQDINPYSLLGITVNSNLSDLRKAYYNLSLLCHPDKGGNNHEMNIVHNAYLYIKEHLDNCKESNSYEELENKFDSFCKKQKETPPPFRDIHDNCNDFIKEFNKKFDSLSQLCDNNPNPFESGYGILMENSTNSLNYPQNDENKPIKETFDLQVIKFEEPGNLPDNYGAYYQFNIEKIEDFSHQIDNITLSDYVKAYSETHNIEINDESIFNKSYEDILNEREKLDYQIKYSENVNETIILDNLYKKRYKSAVKIQKNIRCFIHKKKLPYLLKYTKYINTDFEKIINNLQNKWRKKNIFK